MNLGFYKLKNVRRGKYLIFPVLLVLGLILRILLHSYWTYEGDFRTWIVWADGISKVGFSKFYEEYYWCDYMPGYLYILWLLDHIYSAFPTIPDNILFKLPANLSDLGISILIFFALRKITSVKNAKIASLAYFFNPASLSNSAFWGQVDSVHTLPLLVSILLGVGGHFVKSSLFAAIAFMIKPQSVVVFPIIGFFVIRDVIRQKKEDRMVLKTLILGIKVLVVSIITIFVIILPFILSDLANDGAMGIFKEPIFFVKERFYTAYDKYKYASLNAFNFWGAVAMWLSDQTKFFNITYQVWGTIIFGIFYVLVLGVLIRFDIMTQREEVMVRGFEPMEKQNLLDAYKYYSYFGITRSAPLTTRTSGFSEGAQPAIQTFHAVTLILFALFLFVTRAHERHFLPTIVFFTLIAFRSWAYWLFYGLVSLVYVVDMIYAYVWLTSRGFSSSLIDPFIPVMVFLLLTVFLIVLIDFIRNSIGFYKGTSS